MRKWLILLQEHLSLGRLISAARVALSLMVLSAILAGEPPAVVRRAMAAQPMVAWRGFGLWLRATPAPLIVTLTPPAPSPPTTATTAATPAATATPSQPQASSPPTWIEAPSIGLSAPVVETGWTVDSLSSIGTGAWQVPDGAAGFHKGTAYPGNIGNTVISGHNNIGGEVFRNLIDLALGDEVILYVGKIPYVYTVTQKELVLEQGASEEARRENARWIAATNDERLTLVTCWPYTGNSHRLIIVARPR